MSAALTITSHASLPPVWEAFARFASFVLNNHGLEVVHVSGLNFACELTSNAGGLEQADHISGLKFA